MSRPSSRRNRPLPPKACRRRRQPRNRRGSWLAPAGDCARRGLGVSVIYQMRVGGACPMITERQKAFRQEYRSRIMGWYDGYLHIAIIYAMGAAAFTIYLEHIHAVTAAEWLTIP